jgi:hypothetical protein
MGYGKGAYGSCVYPPLPDPDEEPAVDVLPEVDEEEEELEDMVVGGWSDPLVWFWLFEGAVDAGWWVVGA